MSCYLVSFHIRICNKWLSKNMHNDQRARCHMLRLHKNPVLYQLKKHLVFCQNKCTVDFMVVLKKYIVHSLFQRFSLNILHFYDI